MRKTFKDKKDKRLNEQEIKFKENPKYCKECGKLLKFDGPQLFCDNACSAKFNNKKRKGLIKYDLTTYVNKRK